MVKVVQMCKLKFKFQKSSNLGQWLSSDSKAKLYTTVSHNHFMDMTYSVTENTLRDESPIPCDDETNFTFDSCFKDAIYKVCNI